MATDNTVTPIGNLTPELPSERVGPSRIHQHRRFS